MTAQTIAQLFDLSGKGAVVTGGALGIGRGIASRLAEAGAGVIIADLDLAAAEQTAAQIEANGGKARAIRADASGTLDAMKVVEATVDAFGSVDILVNNAGIYPPCPALEVTEELWDKVLGTNLKGPFFYSQAAARQMISVGRGGKIVNIASRNAFLPGGGVAHYDASKGGLVMLTKALALEFARHNILVNAVAPAGIATPGTEMAYALAAKRTDVDAQEFIERHRARLILGRKGVPDDIAGVVLFLASSAADYMTGSVLVADGGYLLT